MPPGSRSRSATCPVTRPATSPTTRTGTSSPATSSSPGSVGRTDLPFGDWDTLLASIRSLADAYPPETVVHSGPRAGHGARRRARAQPVPGRAPRVKVERPRGTHDILPSEQPLWRRVTGEMERLAGLYGYRPIQTPVFEDTDLFLRTSGQGSDVVQKEMYTFSDRSRPLADAAAGGDGADRARVRRARPPPRAAAAEALHDRADVPLRRAAAAAATASTGSSRSRRSAPTTLRSTPRSSGSTTRCCAGSGSRTTGWS